MLRNCGRTFQERPIRTFLTDLGTMIVRPRARERARPKERARALAGVAGHELRDERRGTRLRQTHGPSLPQAVDGVSLRGAMMNGTARVGFGAHKIWGS